MKGENSNGSINFNVKKLMRRPGKADLSKAAETRRKKNEWIIFNKTQRNIIQDLKEVAEEELIIKLKKIITGIRNLKFLQNIFEKRRCNSLG